MKPITSVISGVLDQVETRQSGTGLQLGETASETSQIANVDQARAKLVTQKPTETDRNLLGWLKSSLGIVASPMGPMMFPPSGGYYQRISHFDFDGMTDENRAKARQAVQGAMTPPTMDQCQEWVVMLHAATARRADGESTLEIILKLYAGALAQYPADVAKQTCMDFALRREKPNWFPTLSELDEACEKATTQRKRLLESL